METFSQISLNFAEESLLRADQPPSQDQPLNIGVRIKKLKRPEDQEPETFPETPSEKVADLFPETPDSTEKAEVLFKETPTITEKLSVPFLKPKSGRGRKSIRQIAEEADLIQIPEDELLFKKHYYTMGEVSEMFRVNQSLLRFWEAEFSILQPKKNKKGDRYFRPIDIKNLHLIYHLLRQRKYTIEGAKDFLKNGKKAEEKFESIKKLEQIRGFLLEMKAMMR